MGVSKGTGKFGGFSMADLKSSCPNIDIEVSTTDEILGRDRATRVIIIRSGKSHISGRVIQTFINEYKRAAEAGLL